MSSEKPTPEDPRKSCYTVSSMNLETMLDHMLENDEVRLAYYVKGMVFAIFHWHRALEGSLVLPEVDFPEGDLKEIF